MIREARLVMLGGLVWAAPLCAQNPYDPLAPLPVPVQTPNATTQEEVTPGPQTPNIVTPAAPPPRTVVVPKDWRGVFDAIDGGNWASAQAGIASLPDDPLTPFAKAELYTAKGSPVIDLASLQALIAQAPELPQANQLALMAYKRGATSTILALPEKPCSTSARRRSATRRNRSKVSPMPTSYARSSTR